MKKQQFAVILSLVVILSSLMEAKGQILNIEKNRLDSLNREKPFRIKLEASFDFYNRSATEDDQAQFAALGSDLNAVYAPGKHAYLLLGEISYVENNDKKILSNGNLHSRVTFNYEKKLSPEVFAQAQYDDFRGLSNRYLLGAALLWEIANTKKTTLVAGLGPMYEFERWRNPRSDEIEEVTFLKTTTNLTFRWNITESTDFNTVMYYQVGYDQSINHTRNRISNNSNLNLRISKQISFTLSFSMSYEDRPIVPITRFIYSIENGLSFTF